MKTQAEIDRIQTKAKLRARKAVRRFAMRHADFRLRPPEELFNDASVQRLPEQGEQIHIEDIAQNNH